MAATVLVLFAVVTMVAGSVLAVRAFRRALLRRAQRRRWDDLVAHYHELDQELDRIWQRW